MLKYILPILLMLPGLAMAQQQMGTVKPMKTSKAKVTNKNKSNNANRTTSANKARTQNNAGQSTPRPPRLSKEDKQSVKSLLKMVEDNILNTTDDAHAKQVILGERQLTDHIELDNNGMISAENTKELAEKYLNAKNTKEAYLSEHSTEYAFLLNLRDARRDARANRGEGGQRGGQNGRTGQNKGANKGTENKSSGIKYNKEFKRGN